MNLEQIQNIKLHFILTTARTGSTMLSSMLNAHPNVISTIEEPFAYNLYPKYHNIKNWTSETIQNYCYDFYLFSEGRLGLQFSSKKELEKLLETYKSQLNYTLAIRITYLCFFPTKDKSDISTVLVNFLLMLALLRRASFLTTICGLYFSHYTYIFYKLHFFMI